MRFHMGFSFSWKSLKKWLLPIVVTLLTLLGFGYIACTPVQAESLSYSQSRWAFGYHQNHSNYDTYTNFTWEALLPVPNSTNQFFVPPTNYGASSNIRYPIIALRFDILGLNLKPDTWYEINVKFAFSGDYIGIYWENGVVSACSVGGQACASYGMQKVSNSQVKFTFKTNSSGDNVYIEVGKTGNLDRANELLTNFQGNPATYQYFYVSSVTIEAVSDISGAIEDLGGKQDQTNQKLDETNENLNDLNDSIKNPDVDANTGNDFFNNFGSEDNGGISSVITAPLILINSLLNNSSSCQNLTLPMLGKEVSIPSGCLLWEEVPGSVSTIYQTIICGFSAYFILKKLSKDIENLKNPNKSEVSTLDL